jgi:hypothetical protein
MLEANAAPHGPGASCEGGRFRPLVETSEWRPLNGTMRLVACPQGHVLISGFLATQDACYPCPSGTYQKLAATLNPPQLVADAVAEAGLYCHHCPEGALCPG